MNHGLGSRWWRKAWPERWRRYKTDPGGLGDDEGDDGGGADGAADDWRAALPEDVRGDPSLQVFKDVGSLAKGFIDTKKRVGKQQGIAVPGEKATPAEIEAFHKALGRPDAPDGYGIEMPGGDAVPKGVYLSEGLHKGFLGMAHQAGLTPGQAKALHGGFLALLGEEAAGLEKAADAEFEKVETALKGEWANKYDANKELARRAAASVFGKDGMQELVKYGFDNNPLFIKKMHALGLSMDEESLAAGSSAAGGDLSIQEMQKRIDEIRADPKGPYWQTKASREHREAVAEVDQLQAQIAKMRRQAHG